MNIFQFFFEFFLDFIREISIMNLWCNIFYYSYETIKLFK